MRMAPYTMSHEEYMINLYHFWLRKDRQPFSFYDVDFFVRANSTLRILKNNGYLEIVGVTSENQPLYTISPRGITMLRGWLRNPKLH